VSRLDLFLSRTEEGEQAETGDEEEEENISRGEEGELKEFWRAFKLLRFAEEGGVGEAVC
jgi:hypothetical protein